MLYQRYNLRDSQVSAYTRQILHGLKYLHDRNVVHRDIKCANILVDANGSVKLADFGLAKATKLNDVQSCKGTAFWMAPEVVNRKNHGYGLPADIWSLGCTVLEMLTREIPYSDWEWMAALFKIGKGEPPPVPESLSKDARDFILQKSEEAGLIRGFMAGVLGGSEVRISHLLFADDTIVFCDVVPEQIMHIWKVLSCFEAVTGLKVDLNKSEMVPVGVVDSMPSLANLLCCRIGTLPMLYLGMPLGAPYKGLSVWNSVLEKIERRLASWQTLYLSKGGRLTLLKSTLSSLPTYFWSLFTIPASVAREEKLQRNFLWNGGDGVKYHLVRWDQDLFPILFLCSTDRHTSVTSVLSRSDDWEPLVLGISLLETDDKLVWPHRKSGQFDVRSYYGALQASTRSRGHVLAACGCMCKKGWETVSFYCEVAAALWGFIFQRFGIQWVLPAKVIDLLFGWFNGLGKHSSDIWNLVPHCLMWSLWHERNSRIFEDKEQSLLHLQESFVGQLYDCSRSWGFTTASSLPEFAVSLNVD
uniref:Protein kinase domain-containing protein n=1 Tax=Fagus sylvatica TaxID=28930 RepID=A0A2N9I832_FAGSY